MITSVKLENVRKRYRSGNFTLCIDYLEFRNQRIHVITGPNGSGKSTLLRLIALLDNSAGGNILFNGKKVLFNRNGYEKLRKNIGFVVQNPYLFNMDVFKNVSIGLKVRGYSRDEIASKVRNMLTTLRIEHLANRNIKELSGGEKQKVAIAQVLVFEPKILLMDEPTASIDKQSELSIEEIVEKFQNTFRPITIVTTHSLDQAYRLSSHILSIEEGKLVRLK